MRHRVTHKKLGRTLKPRRSLMRNLLTSLILHESIKTTEAKAKALRPLVDRTMGFVLQDEPSVAIRRINAVLYSKAASRKMMEVLKEKYRGRTSGFTRIHRLGHRVTDGAPYVQIDLV